MFESLISWLRELIGIDMDISDLYVRISTSGTQTTYQWNYGAMLEYIMCGLLVLLVVKFVFSLIRGVLNV